MNYETNQGNETNIFSERIYMKLRTWLGVAVIIIILLTVINSILNSTFSFITLLPVFFATFILFSNEFFKAVTNGQFIAINLLFRYFLKYAIYPLITISLLKEDYLSNNLIRASLVMFIEMIFILLITSLSYKFYGRKNMQRPVLLPISKRGYSTSFINLDEL